jgi:hypothetical protein
MRRNVVQNMICVAVNCAGSSEVEQQISRIDEADLRFRPFSDRNQPRIRFAGRILCGNLVYSGRKRESAQIFTRSDMRLFLGLSDSIMQVAARRARAKPRHVWWCSYVVERTYLAEL